MKKTKIVSVTIIIALLMTLVALPINTSAKTIKQFEDEVAKYTKELHRFWAIPKLPHRPA